MKISDVLWNAACGFSEDDSSDWTCCQISQSEPGRYDTKSEARIFYEKFFSPDIIPPGCIWFDRCGQKRMRFFHLLMAYEMAKSEGL